MSATLEALAAAYSPLTLAEAALHLGIPTEEAINQLLATVQAGTTTAIRGQLEKLLAVSTPDGILLELLFTIRQNQTFGSQNPSALRLLHEASILTKHSPIPSLPLELALLDCAALLSKPATAIHQEEPGEYQPKQLETAKVASVAAEKVPVIELRDVEEPPEKTTRNKGARAAWKQLIDRVSAERPALAQVLRDTVIHSVEDRHIVVGVRFQFHADTLSERKHAELINSVLTECLGEPHKVTYHTNLATVPRSKPRTIASSVEEAKTVFSPQIATT